MEIGKKRTETLLIWATIQMQFWLLCLAIYRVKLFFKTKMEFITSTSRGKSEK
jgi:hypothetical protein